MHATEFVHSYIDAWNHSDAEGVAEHLVKNGTYCDMAQHTQTSRDGLVENLLRLFAREHHRYQLLGEILANDNSIAFQYQSTPLDGSTEEGWFGAEFMTIKGDGAIKIADYYDPMHTVKSPSTAGNGAPALKYAKSGLSSTQMEKYTGQLSELMDMDKVYLESELTMPKLAEMMHCSVNHLSQAVNSGFGVSFFDFLNSYRIKEAKSMLSDHDPQAQAILDVSFAVGFNSNSAFYAAFKKSTGQTPAQYRRSFMAVVD